MTKNEAVSRSAEDNLSDRMRACDRCGKYGKAWAVWSHPVRMDFMWMCDRCRTDPARRYA